MVNLDLYLVLYIPALSTQPGQTNSPFQSLEGWVRMWFLYCLSWASTGLQICFITLAIAAGILLCSTWKFVSVPVSLCICTCRSILSGGAGGGIHCDDIQSDTVDVRLLPFCLHWAVLLWESPHQPHHLWHLSSGETCSPGTYLAVLFQLQVSHFALLASFPFFSVSSPSFISAVIMVRN